MEEREGQAAQYKPAPINRSEEATDAVSNGERGVALSGGAQPERLRQ